jgi:hypothetical protein
VLIAANMNGLMGRYISEQSQINSLKKMGKELVFRKFSNERRCRAELSATGGGVLGVKNDYTMQLSAFNGDSSSMIRRANKCERTRCDVDKHGEAHRSWGVLLSCCEGLT